MEKRIAVFPGSFDPITKGHEDIIEAINNTLRAGKNIDWREMWGDLEVLFTKAGRDKKDMFDDYIPPHKNLGALFIKAYSKAGAQ